MVNEIVPYVMAFMAVFGYATLGTIAKRTGLDFSPYLFMGVSASALGLVSFLVHYLLGQPSPSELTRDQWLGIAVFTVVNFFAYLLYLKAIALIPVAQYDLIGGIGIVLSACFASMILGEPFHLRYIPAIALMCIGIYVAIGPSVR